MSATKKVGRNVRSELFSAHIERSPWRSTGLFAFLISLPKFFLFFVYVYLKNILVSPSTKAWQLNKVDEVYISYSDWGCRLDQNMIHKYWCKSILDNKSQFFIDVNDAPLWAESMQVSSNYIRVSGSDPRDFLFCLQCCVVNFFTLFEEYPIFSAFRQWIKGAPNLLSILNDCIIFNRASELVEVIPRGYRVINISYEGLSWELALIDECLKRFDGEIYLHIHAPIGVNHHNCVKNLSEVYEEDFFKRITYICHDKVVPNYLFGRKEIRLGYPRFKSKGKNASMSNTLDELVRKSSFGRLRIGVFLDLDKNSNKVLRRLCSGNAYWFFSFRYHPNSKEISESHESIENFFADNDIFLIGNVGSSYIECGLRNRPFLIAGGSPNFSPLYGVCGIEFTTAGDLLDVESCCRVGLSNLAVCREVYVL